MSHRPRSIAGLLLSACGVLQLMLVAFAGADEPPAHSPPDAGQAAREATAEAEDASPLAVARRHLLRGRYAEAAQAYAALREEHPAEASLGLARIDAAKGRTAQAIQTLNAAIAPLAKARQPERNADQDSKPAGDDTSPPADQPFLPDALSDLYAELALLHLRCGNIAAPAVEGSKAKDNAAKVNAGDDNPPAGNHAPADAAVAAALAIEPAHPTARWVQAELHRLRGQVDQAAAGYEWFVDFYNRQQRRIQRPEDLRAIAWGAAQAARWQRRPGDFRFVANTLLPKALKLDADYWPAHYEAGLLFLEKFNHAEATRSLTAALTINPAAAEAHAAVAAAALQRYDLDAARRSIERALEIGPLAKAYSLQADWHLANFDAASAQASLRRAVACNLRDETILGQVAALRLFERPGLAPGAAASPNGGPPGAGGAPPEGVEPAAERQRERLGMQAALASPEAVMAATPEAIIAAIEATNGAAGEFYFSLASRLDDARQFDLAERYYRQAAARLPQLPGPQASLGLMLMRLGREKEARAALESAYEADPFHVRVVNMLEVLDVLESYQRLETEHFVIRYDAADEVLARCAARYLEQEVYPALCAQFAFEPQGKTLIEIFNQARNTGGHGWFSARMVGLPYLGTVGACAGRIVGMVSPAAMPQPFNWARVLKHEFVHVLNLQQTSFNVPHWFTEALAVMNEGDPRPEAWNRLLVRRHAAGTLLDLDGINLGFIRPQSSDDWTLAYCQAELYAEYMLEQFGEDAVAKLLAAFARVATTPEAIRRAFAIDQAEFEAGYRRYVDGVVAQIAVAPEDSGTRSYAALLKAVETAPPDPALLAELAAAQLERKQYASARRHALAALEAAGGNNGGAKEGAHPQAAHVLAQLHLLAGETAQAMALLEAAHDPASPRADVVLLLARLKQRAGETAAAEALYALGERTWPHEARWPQALAALYLAAADEAKLVAPLRKLAGLEVDNLVVRKKLAQLALKRADFAEAAVWAARATHIDAADPAMHRLAGAALALSGDANAAAEHYELAVQLRPQTAALRLEWAKVLLAAGKRPQAHEVLQELLRQEPSHEEAAALLQSVRPSQ